MSTEARQKLRYYTGFNEWWTGEDKTIQYDFSVCDRGLRQYFNIPRECEKVELVLDNVRGSRHSYRYKVSTDGYLMLEVRPRVWESQYLNGPFWEWLKYNQEDFPFISVEIPQ